MSTTGPQSLRKTPKDYPFLWGNYYLSWERAREHFLVMGATGSGKTVLLRRLMQTVLPQIGCLPGRRALVYDSKKDMRAVLLGMGVPEDRILIMNPFDRRSWAWDMAADVQLLTEATELANMLIPERSESQPFFSNTARSVLRGVIEVFMKKIPSRWTLRLILLACANRLILRKLLESHPPTQWLTGLMENEKTWIDIQSTLNANLDRFRYIAAAWEDATRQGRKVSIKEWLNAEYIFLMGNDDNARTELDIVNRLFFDKLAQLINDQNADANNRQTWLFLDEVRSAGKLKNLHSLLLRARSKNCAVVLGFQDTLGMEAEYGEKEAKELLGCPGNLAILHLNANAQAARQWASDAIGQDDMAKKSESHSRAIGQATSRNVQTSFAIQPVYMPMDFYLLGRAGSDRGLQGIFVVDDHLHRSVDQWYPEEKVTISNEELFGSHPAGLRPLIDEEGNYLGRENPELELSPWGDGDTQNLPTVAVAFLEGKKLKATSDPDMLTQFFRR